jgi:hypothetical protein
MAVETRRVDKKISKIPFYSMFWKCVKNKNTNVMRSQKSLKIMETDNIKIIMDGNISKATKTFYSILHRVLVV